ncbi:DNA-binding protein BIN4 [Ziziphus jujuba]|uniref:DNA-binding protein BIN4 n=3 Tax=Ziziphus jujuba TaxID=326968 RepID=A0A6P3ZGG4_ZIZJJ|nr:DNA-binding protein BIN4 [Ziziphus jujuba]XP_015878600.3 DNA-binding protein BIN4 [Ziziphus jujuba]XP_048326874.2 DNA-binding protein BIN4 [Ziziphus jujuba]XP_048326876.2 DNA-binding protein BIN4 [Ziziphus jujuba]XP_060675465.1 DNA-binding protein BIN4 [Ziziphus jujuba]
MSSSREESPDWLRAFQAPTHSTISLSSDSEPSPNGSPPEEDRSSWEEPTFFKSSKIADKDKNVGKIHGENNIAKSPSSKRSRLKSPEKGKGREVEDQVPLEKNKSGSHKKKKVDSSSKKVPKKKAESPIESREFNNSVWELSSGSELCPNSSPKRENHVEHGESSDHKTSQRPLRGMGGRDAVLIGSSEESPSKKASKEKSPKKGLEADGQAVMKEKKKRGSMEKEGNCVDVKITEEEAFDKHAEPQVSSSRLPLMLSEKVQRSKALVECEGDSIDLSGDMGAVGRIIISDSSSGNHEMFLDLKGTIYKTTIVPSRTFCVVSFAQSEAKIEAIMNDFIQLKPQSNVDEAETMVEGTLDGFSFDSEEEGDKLPKTAAHQTDGNEDIEEQTNGKTKGKANKTSGVVRKRGKTAGGKAQPQKKTKKKPPVSKKAKTKK